MDAEIGVRNLADSFRYNVLPDIVAALGLADGKIGVIAESFEDLPEYERLSMLVSSSQIEYRLLTSTVKSTKRIKLRCALVLLPCQD